MSSCAFPASAAVAVIGVNAEGGQAGQPSLCGTDWSHWSSRGSSIARLNWPKIGTPRRRGARLS